MVHPFMLQSMKGEQPIKAQSTVKFIMQNTVILEEDEGLPLSELVRA